MIIYKDLITGDELFNDTYKMIRHEEMGLIEVPVKKVKEESGGIDSSLIGGNASAEEAAEDVDDSEVKYDFDLVLNMRLEEVGTMDKKAYMGMIKPYMKAVAAKLTEEGKSAEDVAKFKAKAAKAVNFLTPKAKAGELSFYLGTSFNPDGMHIALDYKEDGISAFMLFFEDGLIEEKC